VLNCGWKWPSRFRLSYLVALAALVATSTAAGSRALHGGAGSITASGSIGDVQLDRSGVADVVAFAGRPDFRAVGDFQGTQGATRDASAKRIFPSFLVLGYGCAHTASNHRSDPTPYQQSGTYCLTNYYFRLRIERKPSSVQALSGVWTGSPHFHTSRGASPGMSQATVDRREHGDGGVHEIGCHQGIYLASRRTHMLLPNQGGHLVYRRVNGHREAVTFAGGRLAAIGVESTNHPVALLFC
jgi:hypothetical protein